MLCNPSRKYAVVTLSEYNSYDTVIRWEIVRVVDNDEEITPQGTLSFMLRDCEQLLDITNAMPIRPAADTILDLMELETSGYSIPNIEERGRTWCDAGVVQYAREHNFDCLAEYIAPYENMTQTSRFDNIVPGKYYAVYTFKPGV